MDNKVRANVVKAMDIMVRSINDERCINDWLMLGVADGDISLDTPWEEVDEIYYENDEDFANLMWVFLNLMVAAKKGGLYCDGVVGK